MLLIPTLKKIQPDESITKIGQCSIADNGINRHKTQ